MLRDFMLVFDLEDSFKGSNEVTEGDATKVLEYIKDVFEQAGLPAPAKVEDSATFFEERKAEIVTFVQEFRTRRTWRPNSSIGARSNERWTGPSSQRQRL